MVTEKMTSEPIKALYLDLPIKAVSEINRHEHWRARHRRVKAQRAEVNAEWKNIVRGRKIALPCRIILTRTGAKELDDDNLRSSMKAIRDEIANLLGVNDAPQSPAQFDYKQKAIGKHEYHVEIEVQSL